MFKKPISKEMRGKLLGGSFIAVGIPGLVLPVLQGVLLIGAGLIILSVYSPFVRDRMELIKVRYPRVGKILAKAERFVPGSESPDKAA
jgi:hypothetical protein